MVNATVAYSTDDREWSAAIEGMAVDTVQKLVLICEAIGAETIAYLRSHTNEMRPPARIPYTKVKTGIRRAHPGHWADRTGQLAASFDYDVSRPEPGVVLLTMRNVAEYAVYLEAHEGYWVLRGVTEPGGPVDKALRRAVERHAPGWEVRNG